MTTENDFLIVANAATNIEMLATYATDSVIANGVVSGTASSPQVNRIFRQGTSAMGMLGTFMAAQGVAAIDSGNAASLATAFESALQAFIAANVTTAPSGKIDTFAMNTAPTGYLAANGGAISRTTYANLYAAIGTTYGTGDGSTTFNLPDLRGYFVRGFDSSGAIDPSRTFGSVQADAFANHSHIVYLTTANTPTGGGQTLAVGGGTTLTYASGAAGGTETRPKNVAMLICIKY